MKRSTYRRLAGILGVAAFAVALTAAPLAYAHDGDGDDGADHPARLSAHERQVIKKATKQLRSPAAAAAAGFVATDDCVELPGVGGMGYHYVNVDNPADGVIDPRKPEVLVFVPTHDGGRRLGAVEYFQVDADQDLATADDRPSLFGRHPFDGPMLGHAPGQPIHYDKHVWLYERNPLGQLQPWNPRVDCPTP